MKKNQPFNPLPLPADLNLGSEPGAAGAPDPSPGKDPAAGPRKRKTTGSNAPRPKTSRKKKKRKLDWQELKDRIERKLAGLDREKLKKVLLACGIAAGVVLAVLVAIKMFPVGVLLLALLGLATALRFWERLRWIPGL